MDEDVGEVMNNHHEFFGASLPSTHQQYHISLQRDREKYIVKMLGEN